MDSYGERERRRRRAAQEAEWRRSMLDAGCFNPDELSEQGRRILAWLAEWDDWTVGGVVEMLSAAYRAGLAVGRIERKPAAQDRGDHDRRRDSATARLDAIEQQRPEDPEVGL
jgi:hypothetical protein